MRVHKIWKIAQFDFDHFESVDSKMPSNSNEFSLKSISGVSVPELKYTYFREYSHTYSYWNVFPANK